MSLYARGAALLAVATGGCMAQGSTLEAQSNRQTTVIQWINFGREVERGVAVGFDLDRAVTTERDRLGCAQDDFTSPEGVPGIDNNLALLLPLLDLAAENALQSLLQNALNEGRLLIFVEREPRPDGGLELWFRRGEDVPLLGTDGFLLPGQTLALHAESHLGGAEGAVRSGPLVEASGFTVRLPAIVFTTLYVLELKNARIRFELNDDGGLTHGVLAGGLELTQIFDIMRVADTMLDPQNSIEALAGDAVRGLADLSGPDGQCTRISATIEFEAVPAFVFE